MMSHEKLDVYRCAIRFVGLAMKVGVDIPKGYGPLGDQLRRASMSIPLQIAEGAGKRSAPDCRRFFDYARGSAMECCAALDVMTECGFGSSALIKEGKELLDRIAAMLTKLAGRSPGPAVFATAHATRPSAPPLEITSAFPNAVSAGNYTLSQTIAAANKTMVK